MTDHACENYQLNRRKFLQWSAAGCATLMGMPIRELLAAEGAAAKAAAGAKVMGNAKTAEHVILLWMAGGMSHIDTWDPKPGRPTAGEFEPIKTTASGVEISEVLPNIAEQMKHASLIRSIAGREGAHDRAAYHLLTSYTEAPQLVHPSIGSVAAHELEPVGVLPSFVSVGGRARPAGYLGQACEAYFVGQPGQPDPYLSVPHGISKERSDRRLDMLQKINGRFNKNIKSDQTGNIDQTYNAAVEFMHSPALKAFELDGESDDTLARYGESNFGRGCLLARRLVEHGVRFVQVNMGGFDTHSANFLSMRRLAGQFDPAVGSLIADLHSSGMLDKTLVVMLSEFGRTPRINDNAGRDHHARVFSGFFAGAGVKRGSVIGTSDEDGYEPDDRPVQVPDLHASICHAIGVNPDQQVQTPIGRPMRLVDHGTPVPELFQA